MSVGNRGNTRTRPGRMHIRGRFKTTPWRQDPVIRDRMALVHRCWLRGLTVAETLEVVNSAGVTYSIHTIVIDRHNLQVLAGERLPKILRD
jgi:hypothetical protein